MEMRERMNLTKRAEAYAEGNRQAARIILADVERFGGESSLLVRVSRATLERAREHSEGGETEGKDVEQLRLELA
jgi:hypothetical protein